MFASLLLQLLHHLLPKSGYIYFFLFGSSCCLENVQLTTAKKAQKCGGKECYAKVSFTNRIHVHKTKNSKPSNQLSGQDYQFSVDEGKEFLLLQVLQNGQCFRFACGAKPLLSQLVLCHILQPQKESMPIMRQKLFLQLSNPHYLSQVAARKIDPHSLQNSYQNDLLDCIDDIAFQISTLEKINKPILPFEEANECFGYWGQVYTLMQLVLVQMRTS